MPTDTEGGSKQATKNYHDIEWTPKRAAELFKLYSDSTLAMQCQSGSGNQLPGDWEDLRRPVIKQVKWVLYSLQFYLSNIMSLQFVRIIDWCLYFLGSII